MRYSYPDKFMCHDVVEYDTETLPFHIGDDGIDQKIKCKKCGGNVFNVAVAEYRTSIRCVDCLWELCVHDD